MSKAGGSRWVSYPVSELIFRIEYLLVTGEVMVKSKQYMHLSSALENKTAPVLLRASGLIFFWYFA